MIGKRLLGLGFVGILLVVMLYTGSTSIADENTEKVETVVVEGKLEATPTVEEEHGCAGNHDAPGFKCPNAKPPEYTPGVEPVLTEKCGGCAQQIENGGSCQGKYT